MKNLFAVDVTDENNLCMPAEAFCRRRVTHALEEKMDESADIIMGEVEKATRSWPHFIGMGAAMLGCFVFFTIFDVLTEEAESFRAIPAVTWLWLAAAAVSLVVLLLVGRSYSKCISARLETDEMNTRAEQAEAYFLLSRRELGVPQDAPCIDVLGYAYEIKKGKEKKVQVANEHYEANELMVFVEEGHLMLADAAVLYALPLSDITAVRHVEGRARVHCWNKEEEPNKEPYKPYRIRYDDENDVFTVRSVYVLEWSDADCELVVPDYEWERVLQPLTGLSVTATEKAVTITFE